MKTEIYVVAHKKSRMPADCMFLPVQVGKGPDIDGFLRDNTGENIAEKNENYCELTAVYWAWKNREADIKGLVHYRRIFTNGKRIPSWTNTEYKYKNLITEQQVIELLSNECDIILPKAHNYITETAYEHYKHNHDSYDALDLVRKYIELHFPAYVGPFDRAMQSRSSHLLNMMIAKYDIFDKYAEWMFDILSYVENNYSIDKLDAYDKRIFGFISELLLDVWIETNHVKYREIPVVYLEKENYANKYIHSMKGKMGLIK